MDVVTVSINGYSDGDASHRPTAGSKYSLDSNPLYREKLAKRWMDETGQTKIGKTYILDRLPAGYELFNRPRSSGLRDKYLYGHPKHQVFDSPNRFYPHFRHLMEHPNTTSCPCDVCNDAKARKDHTNPRREDSVKPAAKPKGRPPIDKDPQDEEGSPDIYAKVFRLLHKEGTIDRGLEESMSMDWRAERNLVPAMIRSVPLQSSFIPRLGEIVLWFRNVDGEVVLEPHSKEFRIYDATSGQYLGHPQWLAGVITQVPRERVLVQDLLKETIKQHAVNTSGFRVECLPDPNGSAKGLSKQYGYVPMHHIRPMSFWKELLKGIPENKWHPSITHGLDVTATLSMIERYRAEGIWPNCNIHCKGIFIGAEALFIGDAVRLISQTHNAVSGVLRIRDILVKFEKLAVAHDGNVYSGAAGYIHVYLLGEGYTLDPHKSYQRMAVDPDEFPGSLPPGMEGYNKWYHMLKPGKRLEVTYDCVLGRCFEAEAMRLWSTLTKDILNTGLLGTLEAREHSAKKDLRIAESGKRWYWGNYRVDSLDIETMNGFEVGQYNTERDPRMWRSNLKVLDGVADKVPQNGPAKLSEASQPELGFRPINAKSSMVARALHDENLSERDCNENGVNAPPGDSADSMEDEVGAVVDSVISGQAFGVEGENDDASDDVRFDEGGDGEIASPKEKRARLEE